MGSFEKEVIFVKKFLKFDLYIPHLTIFEHIYKIEPLLHFTNKVLFEPKSYTKCLAAMSV